MSVTKEIAPAKDATCVATAPSRTQKEILETPVRAAVRARAILLGLLLIPANCYWIFMMEIVRYSGHPTTISRFFNAVFTLILLLLLNLGLRRYLPRWVFRRSELITIYLMVA